MVPHADCSVLSARMLGCVVPPRRLSVKQRTGGGHLPGNFELLYATPGDGGKELDPSD
jgi:hypothetical protein